MLLERAIPPRRLSEFLTFTQRYRMLLVGTAILWTVAVNVLRLPIESGPQGNLIMAVVVAVLSASVLLIPRAASWWTHTRGYPSIHVYVGLLVLDTAMVTVTVPLTGGPISISFAFYYFLAVGNCYAFSTRGMLLADTFMALAYVGSLLAMHGSPLGPQPLDWLDILIIRVPLIYAVSYYGRWMAQHGDRTVAEEQRQYLHTLDGFLTALEARDGYTRQHSRNVAKWANIFARELGVSAADRETLFYACELHDIGKVGVPDGILNKPGRLTSQEYATMQHHPAVGVQITEHLAWFTDRYLEVIRYHHERWDGAGYPTGLSGERIPRLARLTALCDVFDALINDRPYRKALPDDAAVAIIAKGAGTQFDPLLTRRFLRMIAEFRTVLVRVYGANRFTAASWVGDELQVRLLSPGADREVRLRYNDAGWQTAQGVTMRDRAIDEYS